MSAVPRVLPGLAANDADAQETREWLDALAAVIETEGRERGHFLLEQLLEEARQNVASTCRSRPTPAYVNTHRAGRRERSPGNLELEGRLRAYMRWNAMAMVVKANRLNPDDGGDLGGHISSFASLAHMFAAGFNHFWHAESPGHGGDLLYIQGHSAPGIYARAFLEGRLTEEQLLNFRQEVGRQGPVELPAPQADAGVLAVPHRQHGPGPADGDLPGALPEVPARPRHRRHAKRKVWVFCGDGEMDEPESLGAIGLAAREKLDNLVFVINCNLQRLDGPVRGNGKIIQELEGEFRGSGWNVHQADVGQQLGPAAGARQGRRAAPDHAGHAGRRLPGLQGQRRRLRAQALLRPRPAHAGDGGQDERREVWSLRRGGHDAAKVYAAFHAANSHQGQPTVLLVKTVKGWGMGKAGEGKNTAHQTKKLTDDDIRYMRDRFNIPIPDADLPKIPFYKPADDTPEMKYLHERRQALGGYLPKRRRRPTRASRCRRWRPSRPCSSPPPKAARSAPRRPTCAS
jgi:pyruvate dehydrogenase E1 component